jgi:hypothetical protein
MVKRYRSKNRKITRRSRKQRKNRKQTRKHRLRGGGLPIPSGAVAGVRLDPTDEYSAPVLIRKEAFEEEVLDE